MCCCLRRIVRRVDSVGCPGEHRLDAHGADQFQRLGQRHAVALQARNAIRDAARLGGARIVEILAAPAHAVHLLRGVHRLKPQGERTREVGGRRRRSIHRALFQLRPAGGIALAPADRREPIVLDQPEEFLAPLIAQRLADQFAQGVHVLAQAQVLEGKLLGPRFALAVHSSILTRRGPRRRTRNAMPPVYGLRSAPPS